MATTNDQKLTGKEAANEAIALGFSEIEIVKQWTPITQWRNLAGLMEATEIESKPFSLQTIDGVSYIMHVTGKRWALRKEAPRYDDDDAGCDRCGTEDRVKGSRFCADCGEEQS